ncbi:sulfotransferase family 2 domain-containing protein [Aequorivita marina]|uniref:sulfotransferase family 2 domain-containing protein n=1 Tax=Aequorivita marina TaxID=3073654 RepID=UPI0028740EED|nr:sulfotransferase family 2 domain-containing protein [Aequorivita sp. S2608]MDS1298061.1 sulfotransferase family 2 domain-containing protein [Aequorivita sp. S2608]
MIICHKHKFIFVKTQKTASTSIEIALSGLCAATDILTPISTNDENYRKSLGFQTATNFVIPFGKYTKHDYLELLISGKRKELYNHMSCAEIKNFVGSKVFRSYYKFCFERNPYEKLISLFYHQGGYKKWPTIEAFIKAGELNIIKGFDQYTINKVVAVDDVFKLENLDGALSIISNKLSLDSKLELPKVKLKSNFRKDKRSYKEILTPVDRQMVDIIWARERELMDYKY